MTPVVAPRKVTKRRPRVVLSENGLEHLEALVEAAYSRNPDLADLLVDELGRARVVPERKLPSNVIALGRTVLYRDESTGQEKTVVPVLPEEADIGRGMISVMTPIGIALIGLSEGASFHWETRDGERRLLTVLKVILPGTEGALE